METKGLFKRIAAITMAALTIVTSSGVAVNLLTANANELTKQATENVVDENTNKALQKKDAKVGAQAKLSFSTNEALKRAVDDAGFNIDVKTNKVTSAAIKYNQSLLTLGKDFTATAKRTSYTKNGSKYNYFFTVTVTGKGDYTGSTTRTGVTQVSDIKPATTKKKTPKKSAKTKTVKKSAHEDEMAEIEAQTSDATGNLIDNSNANQKMGGWQIEFQDSYHTYVPVAGEDGKKSYRITYFDHNGSERFKDPVIQAKYIIKDADDNTLHSYIMTKECIQGENIVPVQNRPGYGKNTGKIEIKTTKDFQTTAKADAGTKGQLDYLKGITITYDTYQSIIQDPMYTLKLKESNGTEHDVTFNTRSGRAVKTFPYTGGNIEPQVWLSPNTSSGTDRRIGGADNKDGSVGEIQYSTNHENAEVGTECYLTVTMPKDFNYEKITIYYTVGAKDLTKDMVAPPTPLTYNGQEQLPELKVTNGDKTLVKSTKFDENGVGTDGDYYIDKNGVKAINQGTYTINVIGRGHYAGIVPVNFTISKKKAAKDNQNELEAEMTSNPPALTNVTAPYNRGGETKPSITFTYSPANGTPLTLKEGTDYKVSSTSEDGKWEVGSKPTATVKFDGNYEGELTFQYEITNSSIQEKNTRVSLDSWTETVSDKNTDSNTGVVTLGSQTPAKSEFDPIETEYPQFTVEVGGKTLTAGNDYTVGIPTPVDKDGKEVQSGAPTWPEASIYSEGKNKGWHWQTTINGRGNYSGSIKVRFDTTPLAVDDGKLSVSKATVSQDKNTATVELTYTSKQDSTATFVVKAIVGKVTNFKATVAGNQSAGANIPVTVTGQGNYRGTREVTAGKGDNLADAGAYDDTTANLRVLFFDPYTGEQITTGQMSYYGEKVVPQIIIVKKNNKTWTQISTKEYEVKQTDPAFTGTGTGGWLQHISITAKSGSKVLYGEVTNASLKAVYMKPLDLTRANENKNSRKKITITADTSKLTTFDSAEQIQKDVKLYVKPDNAGSSEVATGAAIMTGYTNNSSNSANTMEVSWNIPSYWSGASYDGTLMKAGEDYVLQNLDTNKHTVDVKALGVKYINTYTINLNSVNIGKSDDFEIKPFTKENAWNGLPVFPTVGLYQKSTNKQIDPTSYYIVYTDANGNTYVLSTYAEKNNSGIVTSTWLTDKFDVTVNQTDNDKDYGKVTAVATSGASIETFKTDSEQLDPESGKKMNHAYNFVNIGDNYSVTIVMKDDKWKDSEGNLENNTGLYGSMAPLTYSITRQSTNPNINAYFTNSTVKYAGFMSKSGQTPKPDLPGKENTENSTYGTKLNVEDTAGNALKYGDDYTISTHSTEDDIYYQYPGVKTLTIIGKGRFAGTSTVSYTVTGDLSKINSSTGADKGTTYFDTNIKKPAEGKPQRQTVYTNGNGGFVYEDGSEFSISDISITIPDANIKLNARSDDDYEVTPSAITSAGNVDLRIEGKGAYIGTHYTIYLDVKESRSGVTWTDGKTSKELQWTSAGYTLGDGELALLSTFGGSVTLQPVTGSGDNITGDTVTVSPSVASGAAISTNNVRPHFSEPGTYTITIAGPPKANQSSQLTLVIKYDLSQAIVDLTAGGKIDIPHQYDGKDPYGGQFDSKVTVTLPGMDEPLKNGQDYTITRDAVNGSYYNAGTYKVVLSAGSTSKFWNGAPDLSYDILPLNESDNLKLPDDLGVDLTYNGKDQSSSIKDDDFANKVTYDDNGTILHLNKGTDYTVSYPDGCTRAGKLRYTVTGKGNYAGASKTGYFTIKQYDLSPDSVKVIVADQYYQGGADVEPASITVNSLENLVVDNDGTQYTATYLNNKNTGTAQMTITPVTNGNFKGTKVITFQIEKLDIQTAVDKSLINTPATYNGSYLNPDTYIQLYIPRGNNKYYLQLSSDQSGVDKPDFKYSFQRTSDGDGKPVADTEGPETRPLHAGTYTVTLTALAGGRLGGTSAQFTFTVNQQDISKIATQFTVDDADWTGSALTAEKGISVKQNGSPIDTSKFTVTPNTHVTNACGTLSEMRSFNPAFDESELPAVTIAGHGDYTGSVKRTFRIGKPFESNTTYTLSDTTIRYDGQEHIPGFTLSSSNSKINIANVVYSTQKPSDARNAGDYAIILTATEGPLYGTKVIKYSIYPAAGSTWTVEFADGTTEKNIEYEGIAETPEVKVFILGADRTRTEMNSSDYKVTYANNNQAGTASVTVDPTNYEGTKTLYFRILGADITGDNFDVVFADGLSRRKYTGSAITPKVTLRYYGSKGTVTLTQDRDFSLTYENNTNAGAANVKVLGIGNYTGSKELPFSIWADLNDKTSTFTIPKQMYTGQPITELSGATIKAGGNDLKLGTDYKLSITSTDSFRTKGTAIFTAEGQYYEGTRTVQFDIGNDASMYNVLGVAATYVYDRQAHKPVPVITDKEGTVYPTDSVTYSSTSDGDTCVNAGYVRMQIVITSHGQTVTIPYNYQIQARDINTASMTPIADVDYNGKAHTPTIRITDGTHLLTGSPTSSDGSADFTYTYYNNVQPGIATVTINGINNYTGIANLYFSINVKEAPQMKVTAMPSGRLKVSWNKVSGVSGYRIFYAPQNGSQKQVNIGSSKKTTYLTGLTRGVLYTVGLQSYVRANGQNGYSSASVQQIATSTTQPKITSAKSTGKGKIKLTWKKVSNATAYMVYRKTSGSKKWTRVKTTKNTSFTNTGLKSGRKYTYKVISYKQSGVKRSFSKYSKGKTVRAK